jgi:hypothetical protein
MPAAWSLEHAGRRIEVAPVESLSGYKLELKIDGEQVAEGRSSRARIAVSGDDVTVKAQLAWHGNKLLRAELVDESGALVPLDPPAGTFAARREQWARRHPVLFAARHALGGVGSVLVPLLGIGLLLQLLPAIPIDLPSLPLPDVSGPDVDLPDLPEPPGWVQAIASSAKYWGPILFGIGLGAYEYRRRRRRPAAPRGGDAGAER